MKIAMGISSLGGGGAERVLSIMANYWVERGKQVMVITLAPEERDVYRLDPRVERTAFDLERVSNGVWEAVRSNLERILQLRKALQQGCPDVIIGFSEHMSIMLLLASWGLSIPVIVFEHTDPRQAPLDRAWAALRLWCYRRAKGIVLLTEELKQVAAQSWPERLLHTIPNPAVVEEGAEEPLPFELPPRFVVAMGRLVSIKGFDMLLEAFARVGSDDWSLVILGEGEERQRLERQVRIHGLEGRVMLPGRVDKPFQVLRQAQLFVLSSRFEGFPMALVEAMACGLPAVSFNCPTGPSDIIRDGIDGILVPREDVDALARAMQRLMEDDEMRIRLGSRAPDVRARFDLKKVMGQWDRLLESVR